MRPWGITFIYHVVSFMLSWKSLPRRKHSRDFTCVLLIKFSVCRKKLRHLNKEPCCIYNTRWKGEVQGDACGRALSRKKKKKRVAIDFLAELARPNIAGASITVWAWWSQGSPVKIHWHAAINWVQTFCHKLSCRPNCSNLSWKCSFKTLSLPGLIFVAGPPWERKSLSC